MKNQIIALAFAILIAPSAIAQKKPYVCQPCGSPCDDEVYDAGGTCKHCRMPLVDKSTVALTNLSPKEFCDRITANPEALILDVRSPAEFAGTYTDAATYGHFKNAMNINVEDLPKRLSEIKHYKDREILIYCSHSHRSPRAAYYLGLQGFKNIKNMAGGVSTIKELSKERCFKENYVAHSR